MLERKSLPWEKFEEEVFERAQGLVHQYLTASRVESFWKKRYFSVRRNSYVTFEIAFEAWQNHQTAPWLTWVWECKDYPNRAVDVNEVEVFASQLEQTGIVKGTIVTRKSFTKTAIAYARSHSIGLAVLNKELIPVVCFSSGDGMGQKLSYSGEYLLLSSGHEYEGKDGYDLDAFIQMQLRRWGAIPSF